MRLHHVGYVVKEISEIADTYVRRFGYTLASPIIHDVTQTAFVQFLRLAGDQTYLEFVAPDSPQSKLTGALERGGGLNHLCYAVDDLEAAALHLRANGLATVAKPVPAVAFGGRRISWHLGKDRLPIELVERRSPGDACDPESAPR
jgi:methylmalonyl-CoA/ethylmalonyl-CoA epimerase